MNILLSNDDGIDSPFLRPLAETFAQRHTVTAAAPSHEQSWIGKAMSRRGSVQATKIDNFPCEAYALTGTPSDCVNIALGHLCRDKPDVVLSGINIGHNAGLSFIASSGTIGGALEGAFQGIPSIAASMYLDPDRFHAVSDRSQPLSSEMANHVQQAAAFLVEFVETLVQIEHVPYGQVHSLNFPNENMENARLVKAPAARTVSASLFKKVDDTFQFVYNPLETLASDQPTDREVIHSGNISHTLIDFKNIDNNSY